jgi:pimeloyl-ACP methyl ester carboxylesterase
MSQKAESQQREVEIVHGYAQLGTVRLHYVECGRGDDLVIMLHGFPEFWYSWRHQLPVLGKRCHVVAPDMRGYNLSDKPTRVEDYRIESLVEDVIGLIGHFGANRAALVAHDWGAGVAWAVAQKHPEYLSKLVVMQVPPAAAWRANLTAGQLLRSWYMFFFQLPRLPEWYASRNNFAAVEEMFRKTVVRKGSFSSEDVEAYKEALRQPGALTAGINYYRANVSRLMSNKEPAKEVTAESTPPGQVAGPAAERQSGQLPPSDGRVRVPTLFIFAEQDHAIVPETVRGVRNYVSAPYWELRIADCGHWVQNEAVDEVNSALLKFLGASDEDLKSGAVNQAGL